MTNSRFSSSLQVILWVAAAAIALMFLREFSSFFNIVFLAIIIVFTSTPLLYWLKSKNVNEGLAIIITFFVVVIVIIALVAFMALGISRLVRTLPEYVDDLESAIENLRNVLNSLGIAAEDFSYLLDLLNIGALVSASVGFLTSLFSAVSDGVMVFLVFIFLLVDMWNLPQRIEGLVDRGYDHLRRFVQFERDIRSYVVITAYVGLFTGALNAVFLIILGVDFPILWGILAFFLSFIPTIGFWLALIPPMILGGLESGWVTALIVVIGYIVINGAAENIVKPRYMGRGLNLTPSVIFVSVVFWALILGPIGAILSVPLTLAIKELLLEGDESTMWIASLLSASDPEEDEGKSSEGLAN